MIVKRTKKPYKIWCMCKVCTNKREKNTDSYCKTNLLHQKETESHPEHQNSWNSRFIVERVLKNFPHANVKRNFKKKAPLKQNCSKAQVKAVFWG